MKVICLLIVGLTLVAAADVALRKNHSLSELSKKPQRSIILQHCLKV